VPRAVPGEPVGSGGDVRVRLARDGIRGVHTAIFLAELAVTAEAAVFIANRGVCPLTPMAERFGATRGSVSDIFLPDVVARTIPIWSSALLVIAVSLHVRSLLAGRR
jgi:hypothetical protein